MTLSNRGWKREVPSEPTFGRVKVRRPGGWRAFTPGRVLILLGLLAIAVLLTPHHFTVGGYHVHPGFFPSLAPYIFL